MDHGDCGCDAKGLKENGREKNKSRNSPKKREKSTQRGQREASEGGDDDDEHVCGSGHKKRYVIPLISVSYQSRCRLVRWVDVRDKPTSKSFSGVGRDNPRPALGLTKVLSWSDPAGHNINMSNKGAMTSTSPTNDARRQKRSMG